jgi:signal transduction histidine kinase
VPGFSLLLIDADRAIRDAVTQGLTVANLSAEVEERHGEADAVLALEQQRYDCLIVDDPTGDPERVRRLRAAAAEVPILAICERDDLIAPLIAAGALDALPHSDLTPLRLARRVQFALRVGAAEAVSKQVAAQLHAERLLLEHAVAGRDELMAVVSHDLRNPLSAIALAIDELGVDDLDPPARARYVAAVRRALGRANRLITDLLDVAKIDAGRLVIEPSLIDLGTLVDQVARDYELQASGAKVKLTVVRPQEKLTVQADRERLLQAMSNLVANALNHGRQGGAVELGVEALPDAKGRRLWVGDRGPGIPADALPHVFDRYWQARRQRRGGAGLGLAIVRGIADAHGGRVFAVNREHGGARFVIELPNP